VCVTFNDVLCFSDWLAHGTCISEQPGKRMHKQHHITDLASAIWSAETHNTFQSVAQERTQVRGIDTAQAVRHNKPVVLAYLFFHQSKVIEKSIATAIISEFTAMLYPIGQEGEATGRRIGPVYVKDLHANLSALSCQGYIQG
jgi:hypothetical protein